MVAPAHIDNVFVRGFLLAEGSAFLTAVRPLAGKRDMCAALRTVRDRGVDDPSKVRARGISITIVVSSSKK